MKAKILAWFGLVLILIALVACAGSADDGANGSDNAGGPESLDGGFVWRREGGIAGFCDVVEVSADGVAKVSSCASDPPRLVADTDVSGQQLETVSGLVRRLASFQRERKDPATADAMTLTIDFTGSGDAQPTDADIAAIDALATEVLRAAAQPK